MITADLHQLAAADHRLVPAPDPSAAANGIAPTVLLTLFDDTGSSLAIHLGTRYQARLLAEAATKAEAAMACAADVPPGPGYWVIGADGLLHGPYDGHHGAAPAGPPKAPRPPDGGHHA